MSGSPAGCCVLVAVSVTESTAAEAGVPVQVKWRSYVLAPLSCRWIASDC